MKRHNMKRPIRAAAGITQCRDFSLLACFMLPLSHRDGFYDCDLFVWRRMENASLLSTIIH